MNAPFFPTDEVYRYLRPLWRSSTIYHESGMIVGEEGIPLLYAPKEILAVTNYGINVSYVEGVDWCLRGGKICPLPGSRMPITPLTEYYQTERGSIEVKVEPTKAWRYIPGREYLFFGESDTFTRRQVAVTYTTEGVWEGPVPKDFSAKFPRTLAHLEAKEPLKVLFFGDSITFGCNASGTERGGMTPPYMPPYPVLVKRFLETAYDAPVLYENTSVCGWNTKQALDHLEEKVFCYDPHLLVLAFGMNDYEKSPRQYGEWLGEIVEQIHNKCPDTEVLLVSPMLPNPEAVWWYSEQEQFWREQEKLTEKYSFVGYANMTVMHRHLLNRGKRYFDMTANNVNHPGDFLGRLYAQVVLMALLGERYLEKF